MLVSFQVSSIQRPPSWAEKIARTFEATRSLVSALPWGIDPKPPAGLGFYQARLFVTREDYFADGGPENSGGVYMSKDRIFRIPFRHDKDTTIKPPAAALRRSTQARFTASVVFPTPPFGE